MATYGPVKPALGALPASRICFSSSSSSATADSAESSLKPIQQERGASDVKRHAKFPYGTVIYGTGIDIAHIPRFEQILTRTESDAASKLLRAARSTTTNDKQSDMQCNAVTLQEESDMDDYKASTLAKKCGNLSLSHGDTSSNVSETGENAESSSFLSRFMTKALHPTEAATLLTMPSGTATDLRRRAAFLASRWAAKEAFTKAVGSRLLFPEMELRARSRGPAPALLLHGAAAAYMAGNALRTPVQVSVSHDGEYAVAVVTLEQCAETAAAAADSEMVCD